MPPMRWWSAVPSIKLRGCSSDQTIRLTGVKASECAFPLRRIAYRDPDTGKRQVFLTNHFKLSARTIAAIYKERWQIEIFFRWIKQNLRIKAFIGNSENAVLSQIFAAPHGLSAAWLSQVLVQPWHYLAKFNAIITTQPIQNLHLQGTF